MSYLEFECLVINTSTILWLEIELKFNDVQ